MAEPTDPITRQELADLLTAIREVLDVPYPDSAEDASTAAHVLRCRTAFVRGVITNLAAGAPGTPWITASAVRSAAGYYAITYVPYDTLRVGALAEQRHQLLDPAVPPLSAAGPDVPPLELTAAQAPAGLVVAE
jgi:hypothetical protein